MTEIAERVAHERTQDPATSWWAWPNVRLALLRGAVFGPVAIAIGGRPENVVWAWLPVVLALFEAWAARRERSRRQVMGLVGLAFLLATVGLLAAWFQTVHVRALVRWGSLDAAMNAVSAEPARLLGGGRGLPECIFLVYCAQVGALALTAPLVLRLGHRNGAVLALLLLVAAAPLADWLILEGLRGFRGDPKGLLLVSAISSALLAAGAFIVTPVVLFFTWLCSLADRRLARA